MPREIIFAASDLEADAMTSMAKEHEFSEQTVMRQALRLYQLVEHKRRQGLEMGFYDANGQRVPDHEPNFLTPAA